MFSLALTAWSIVKASRTAQYAVLAAILAGLALWYLTARDKRVVAEVMARSIAAANKRLERAREIRTEIKRLPRGERAARLRKLNRSG